MKTNRLFALGLMTALASGACGDDSSSKATPVKDSGTITLDDGAVVPNPVNDGGTSPDSGGTTNPDGGGGAGSGVITSAGGSVTSADGNATVTFTRYAFSRPTKVTVAPLADAPTGAQGTVYSITPTTEPIGTSSNATVKVTLKYTAAQLGTGSPQDLKIGQFRNGKWVEVKPGLNDNGVAPTKADPSKMSITAQVKALGPVALLGGVCVNCPRTDCTALTDTCTYIDQYGGMQAGKCVGTPTGNACLACRPTCDDDNDGYCIPADCNGMKADINPSAVELCNGFDDNCDGFTDEGCIACATDADCPVSKEQCSAGFCIACNSACTEGGACSYGYGADAAPGTCHAFGKNKTCAACYAMCDKDFDGECPTAATPGQAVDCNDADPTINSNTNEICGNSVDDNCNNQVDENCGTCSTDAECPHDGLVCVGGACQACPGAACDPVACAANGMNGTCETYGKGCSRCISICDTDKDGYCGSMNQDCQEGNPAVNQGALELCDNGVDDNCNGHIDEGCNSCKGDADCQGEFLLYCNALGACDGCNPYDANNCKWPQNQAANILTIPGQAFSYGRGCGRCVPPGDTDGDGYVTADLVARYKAATPSVDFGKADCAEMDATIFPGAVELCNMKDDNCDGTVDELCTTCDSSAMCAAATICDNSR